MSNRSKWAHWKQPKRERHPLLMKLVVGIAFTALGGLLVLSRLQGLRDHVLWYHSFNFVYGTSVSKLTLGLILVGAVFLLSGIAILVHPE